MNDKELSQERKKLQEKGLLPVWFTTGGWQMFKQRYLYQADNAKQQYERIATTLDATSWYNLSFSSWLNSDKLLPLSISLAFFLSSSDA